MAWTAPRTWVVGEIVTAALGNTHWRDNLRYLKGLDGIITLNDGLILPDGAGYYLHIPALTTTQRDALTPTNGMMIYNSTTTQFNKYENGAWRADLAYWGDISSLQIASQAQGDIFFRGASVIQRLAASTSGFFLKTNGPAADPSWGAPAGVRELFAPVTYASAGITASGGDHPSALLDAPAETAHVELRIPTDFASLTSVVLVIIGMAALTLMNIDIATRWGKVGESEQLHTDAASLTKTTVANQIGEIDISTALDVATLEIGDQIAIRATYSATSPATNVRVLGVKLKYA